MTKNKKRTPLKPVSKGGSGRGIGGTNSTQFTNAEQIKNRFFAHASSKRAGKESGDAGYWQGGRCNWGGSHNLSEDSQALAKFANSVANISNEKQNLTLAINEQEFNNKKQQLVNRLQDCINKCQTSDSYSVASICCIWNDFFGSFLKPWLDGLRQKFQADLNQLQGIEPKHQKEVLQLEAEIRGAEAKYNEAMANAAKETDPAKKAQFIAIAQGAERTIKQAKQKLIRNPLSKYVEYSRLMDYVSDLERMFKGNVPNKPPTVPKTNPNSGGSGSGSGTGGNNPDGGQTPWTPWGGSSNSNNQRTDGQQQLIIFAGLALLIIFYLYSQKEETYD